MKPLKALISKSTLNRAHSGNVLTEIKNFNYEDTMTPGNIILISGKDCPTHHGIVLSEKQTKKIQNFSDISINTLNKNGSITYWATDVLNYKNTFPKLSSYNDVYIVAVYKATQDTKNISDEADIINIYKKYNLIPY